MAETSPTGARIWEEVRRHLRNAGRADFQADPARAHERKALAEAARPIQEPRAQDYFAWRRSMSLVALAFAAIAIVLALIDTIDSLSSFGDQQYITSSAALLVIVMFLAKAALVVGLGLSVRYWTDARLSTRALAWGWGIAIAVPLVVILLPLTDVMFDWDALRFAEGGASAEMQRVVVETLLAVAMFWSAVPSLLALFPGLLRAAMVVKTLLPARGVGPVVAAAAAPIYAVFFIVVFGQLQQLSGSIVMGVGILLVAAAPLVFLQRAHRLAPPLGPDEALREVGTARSKSRWVSLAGLLCVLVTLFETKIFGVHLVGWSSDKAMVGIFSFLDTLIWFAAMLTTYTVVASDGLLRAMRWADESVATWSPHPGRAPDAKVLGAVAEALRASADPKPA